MAITNPQTGQAFEENKNPFNNEVVDPTFAKITQEDYANTVQPPAPPADTTPPPANPDGTPGQAYAGLVDSTGGVDSFYKDQESYYKDLTAPVDEAAIRQNTINSFQDQIDALNRVYAEKKRVETIRGEGRLGSSGAVQARRGLLGSDFGAAQTEKVSQYNKGEQDSIDAQRSAEVANILGQARQEANNEINAKRQARQSGLPQYLEFLKGQDERKEKRVQTTIENILYSEVEATEDLFASLAKELGVSKETVKGMYNKGKTAQDKANAKEGFTLGAGEKRYDSSGKEIATGGEKSQSITDKYGSGIIGEYNYYADQEKTAGRTPISFTAYQNEDANRKAVGAGKGAEVLTPADALVLGVPYGTTREQAAALGIQPIKPPTAEQSKTALYAERVKQANDVIDLIGGNFTGKTDIGGSLPNVVQTEERQAYEQAKKNFVTAILRRESGAAIAPSEYETAASLYFPQAGDSQTVIDQKKTTRDIALKNLINEASSAYTGGEEKVTSPKAAFDSLNTGSTYEDAVAQYGAEGVQKMIDAQAKTKPLSMGENGSAISAKLASVSTIPDGSKGGQCGRFVNQQTGLGLGDSYQSKMAKMDKSIKEPAPGMAFVMPYGSTGHTGIILNVENGIATVKDSNYGLDEKVRTHKIPVSSMTGFAYPKPSHLTA